MFSVVSENNTPILPYIAHRDSGAQDVVATYVLEQCADFQRPRFYHGEPACEVRLAVALTTALLALRHDPQAVVVLATARQIRKHAPSLPEALGRAVQVARTGKVVELVSSRQTVPTNLEAGIQGMAGCYHLGEYRDDAEAHSNNDGTGIFVFRADSFLVEAEILCSEMLALCQVSLETGHVSLLGMGEALDDLATLSFWHGFWTRTENRAAVVIGEQPNTAPLHLPRVAAVERRSLQG